MNGLIEWRTFYENHATYRLVGKVVGNFYTSKGLATPLLGIVEMNASEYSKEQEDKKKNSPSEIPCAFKWHKDTGGFVSCDPHDGVTTHPRRVMMRQADGKVKEQCLCLPLETQTNATVLVYEMCAPDSTSCQSSPPKTPRSEL